MKSLSSPDSAFTAMPDHCKPVEPITPENDLICEKHPLTEAYHLKREFDLGWMPFLDSTLNLR
jgi:hypothetical protein